MQKIGCCCNEVGVSKLHEQGSKRLVYRVWTCTRGDCRTDKTASHHPTRIPPQAMSGLLSVAVFRLLQGGTKTGFRIGAVRSDQEPLGAIRPFQCIEH